MGFLKLLRNRPPDLPAGACEENHSWFLDRVHQAILGQRAGGINAGTRPSVLRALFLFFVVFFLQDGGGGDGVVFIQAEQANPLRGAARFTYFVGVDADHLAVLGDDHDVGLLGDLQRGNNRAVAFGGLHVDDPFAAARGDAVFGERRALAVAFFGYREHERAERILDLLVFQLFEILRFLLVLFPDDLEVRLHRVHRDDVVFLVQVHAVDAAGVAAHGAHFGLAEEDGLPFVAGEEHHLLAVGKLGADQFVPVFEVDGDDAGRARVGELGQRGFFHGAVLGGHEDELVGGFEIARRDESGKLFVFLKFHQAVDGLAPRGGGGFRNFVDFHPVHAALRGEQQDVAVRGRDEEMLDEILLAGLGADAALAAARLVAVGVGGGALDVAGVAHGDEHFGVGDQVFQLDFVHLVHDLRAPVVSVGFLDVAQLGDNDRLEFFVAGQDFFEFGDAFANGFQFLENFVDRELGQAVELQLEDGVHLDGSEAARGDGASGFAFHAAQLVLAAVEFDAFDFLGLAAFADGDVGFREELQQVLLGFGAAGRSPDDADDGVQMVERHLIAGENVFAFASLAQFEARAPQDDVAAVFDEQPDDLDQAHLARLSADDGQQDHAERFLHLRVLEKIVENQLRFLAALQFDDDAHAVAVALVSDVADAFDLLVLDQFGDAFDQAGLVDLIGNLGDHDIFPVLAGFFDRGLGAHGEAAAPGFVGRFDAFASGYVSAGRKVRAGNDFQDFLKRGFRLLDQRDGGVDDFAQIVRRYVGGHADGDAAGAVDQKVRNARGQNGRFFFGFVEVGNEVDGFFLDVGEEFFGNPGQAGFGVTHRRGHVAVDRAEVALAVHQRIAHVEVLRHSDQGVIHRGVAVRMVFAEDFADDLGAFAVGARRGQAEFVHAEKDAAMHGFEAVAHIGQRAPDDHGHGIVEIRLAHLGFNVHRYQDWLCLFVRHVPSDGDRVPSPSRNVRSAQKPVATQKSQDRACCKAQALTESNASAALLKRRAANSASAARRNRSRSSGPVKLTATPRALSGASVGVARNSLTASPQSPGNVVQPNW